MSIKNMLLVLAIFAVGYYIGSNMPMAWGSGDGYGGPMAG